MKICPFSIALLLVLGTTAASAQTIDGSSVFRNIDVGIKAGGTFTHGFTVIPTQTLGAVTVPELENNSNGIGYGYTGGIWARKNFSNFYVQAEVMYNRFLLKQKTDVSLDVNANPTLANALPISVRPGVLNASLNVVSESALETINVPVLIGKRWLDGKLRGYAGPNFIFVRKAEATRLTSGQLNANTAVGFPQTDIPTTTSTTNLLNRYEARNLEVKDFTYALEIGVGYNPIPLLDIDLRYAVPVGGVYRDATIKGFLGIATVSVGVKLF